MGTANQLREEVKQKYGEAAQAVADLDRFQACCDPGLSCCDPITTNLYDPITTNLYNEAEKGLIPEKAVLASLGCGNPTALIELKPGEVVLDPFVGAGTTCRRMTRVIIASSAALSMSNGPATAAPSVISIAITTPPSS